MPGNAQSAFLSPRSRRTCRSRCSASARSRRRRISKIGFETAGTLVELMLDQGDSVKAGTLLARLHSREQEAHVAQARAAVMQAQAAIGQAEASVEKAEAVRKQKAASMRVGTSLSNAASSLRKPSKIRRPPPTWQRPILVRPEAPVSVARANLEQAKAVSRSKRPGLPSTAFTPPSTRSVMTRYSRARLGAQRQRGRVHSWSIPPPSGRSPTSTRPGPGRSRSGKPRR